MAVFSDITEAFDLEKGRSLWQSSLISQRPLTWRKVGLYGSLL